MDNKGLPAHSSLLPSSSSKPLRITLVEGQSGIMRGLQAALEAQGYQAQLFSEANIAAINLSKVDMVLLEASVAYQPRSSKFVKVPTILVLTDNPNDKLPPWLRARHVFLLHPPQNPRELVDRLADYLPSRIPDFGAVSPNDLEHLALLFGITQFLSGRLDLNDLFERTLALAPYLEAQFAALLLQEGDETIYYRSTQPGREELTGPAGRRFARRLIHEGLEGWVLQHNQAIILPDTQADPRWFRAPYLPDQSHCMVALPINLERVEARGVYLLGHTHPGFFTERHLPLFKAAMIQIGMAIENAILFKNQSQRSVQLALINEVSQAATSILNLDVMLITVVQAIRRSFACYSVSIHLYNQRINLVELRAKATADGSVFSRLEENEPTVTHQLRQGLIGWSVATNKTVLADDVTQDPRHIFSDESREVRAELCVPITLGVKTIGVLDLQSTELEAFDKYHVAALETLADQLAIAIENARLYDAINQHLNELKSLNEIGQAVTSTLDLQEILTLITDQTTRLMEVAAASVALRDDDKGDVWFAAASGEGSETVIGLRMARGQGIAGWVADKGESIIVPNVYLDGRFFAEMDKQSGFITKSILCVPLQTKGHTIGALEVMNKKRGTFNKDDLSLLQALAVPAATAIENAQLYEEQTRTIQRLAETQNQLVQSAKMAAVGELAAGVAHEINNPLTTIIGLTSLLLDTALPDGFPEETEEDLQMINKEARRARDIVRSLLNFARAALPRRQPIDFNQLIEEAIFLVYTKSVSQKVVLEKGLTPLPQMLLDINQMKQVIVNLLNNAIQAMLVRQDRPATLTISTALKPMNTMNLPQEQNGKATQALVCKISDTGHGIKPEHLDKIFDPFFTTKEVGQGTGLGLSISYGIIEKHGGNIRVESNYGQGSTFTITLPVMISQTEALEPSDYTARAILK
jgi:two-component system, NtrC family, sensor kinase